MRRNQLSLPFAFALTGLLCLPAEAQSLRVNRITLGSIVGVVSNVKGIAQMGATVTLYNRAERAVTHAISDERGAFNFDSLPPDIYSLRVSLPSFVPAYRGNITVQPGMRSFLAINLASVLSSIELIYTPPGQASLISDDWKWVLRGSLSTRPVLRFDSGSRTASNASIFSNTRGLVRVSAGDGSSSALGGSQSDLGTAFALATLIGGSHQLQLSGNVGLGAHGGGLPSAGFSTRISRVGGSAESALLGSSPELQISMRQLYLPVRTGNAFATGDASGAPALRTMSATFADRAKVGDDIELLYGATLESVQFLDRLNYLSPFARLSYKVSKNGTLEFGYSSGLPPVELYQGTASADTELQNDLTSLSLFPRISLVNGRTNIQRAENFEMGYSHQTCSRQISGSVFRERVANAAVTASGDASLLDNGDFLPDAFSKSSVFNIGNYSSLGLMASVTQNLTDNVSVSVFYGNTAVIEPTGDHAATGAASELRSMVRTSRQNWTAARVQTTIPWIGTRVSTSYQWADSKAITPVHRSLVQRHNAEPGWNIQVRQPIPSLGLFAGRLEALADFRNLLAQGYLPLTTADGRRILLIQSPRALRGGLAFIF